MFTHTLTTFCGIGGAFGLATGLALLIAPRRTLHERTSLRRWLLEIDLVALVNRRRSIERPLYRHHRLFGAIVIVGAVAPLATLWGLRNRPLLAGALPEILGTSGAEAVILATGALAAFLFGIGVFLLIRPSALKRFEKAANRWIEPFSPSTRAAAPAETGMNRLILRAPRITALLLLAAGLVCLLAFAE